MEENKIKPDTGPPKNQQEWKNGESVPAISTEMQPAALLGYTLCSQIGNPLLKKGEEYKWKHDET